MIEAHIVADSISPQGKRLTTFKLRYPRFIHAEFMTHRVISRNASSSRAVPVRKLLEEVRSKELKAKPVLWGSNIPGMQAGEELSGDALEKVQDLWNEAANEAAYYAEKLQEYGLHKQWANRLLEPFSHINVLATATEWDNFFGLRLHKDAQPEMHTLALAMWQEYETQVSSELLPGQWHLPFVSTVECARLDEIMLESERKVNPFGPYELAIKVSVARCARVSYESFETGKRSRVEEDLKLYERLMAGLNDPTQPLHASPTEHQATPIGPGAGSHESGQQGNFVGWRQYRKMLPGEAVAPLPEEFRR
jgi:thymidylate synthase ThyX